MSKKIFVFTTGRAGSVTLFKLLSNEVSANVIHEGINKDARIKITDFKDFNKKLFYKNNSWILNDYTLSPSANKHLEEIYAPRDSIIKKSKIYIDINPYQYMLTDYLKNKYPDAKFVQLIRNGYGVVNSYHKRLSTTYPDKPEGEYVGYQSGKPRPKFKNEFHFKNWDNYDRVSKISWFWAFVNARVYNCFKNHPNFFILKTENFSSYTPELISETFNIDINDTSILLKKHNKSNVKVEDIFDNKENIKKFNKIAGKTLIKFGYEIR